MTGTWLIVHGTSGREELAALSLAQEGYSETFYPYDEIENPAFRKWMRRKGAFLRAKRKPPRKPPRFIRQTVVKGYTFVDIGDGDRFALVDACRRISEKSEKLTLRVVAPGGIPYAVSDAVMLQMKRIPGRLQELLDEAERAEREAELARRPVVGGKARILDGALAGETYDVEHIADGWVTFSALGGRMKAPVAAVERV